MDLFTQLTNLGHRQSQIPISHQSKSAKKREKKLNDWLKEKYIHCTISEVKIPNISNVTCYTQGSSILLQTQLTRRKTNVFYLCTLCRVCMENNYTCVVGLA